MKIKIGHLKAIIREMIEKDLHEAFKVSYTEKNGKPGSMTFPSEKLAAMYARNYKDAKIEPVEVNAPNIEVNKVQDATLDDMRASSKAFYKQAQAGEKFAPRETPKMKADREAERQFDIEQQAEQEMEYWADARAAGMTHDDAANDLDWLRRTRRVKY